MLQAAPPALWSSKKSVDKGDNSAEETWGANRKAGCPSGLAPFDHTTTTMTKKTLFQTIGWRLEQGQQVFFRIWFFEGDRGESGQMASSQAEGQALGRKSVAPKKQVANLPSHLTLHRGNDVGIDIQGHFHGSMPKPIGYELRVDPGREQQSCMAMPH